MDQDDPEKRIAELERHLAEQNLGAGLPPASADPDHAAASGRFVAIAYKRASTYGHRQTTFAVCVTSNGLTVDKVPGDVFAFRDAQLGLWAFGNMTMGMALHLQCGDHRFVVGGRDYRVATDPQLEAAPVDRDRVDAWMWASDFYELLAAMTNRSGSPVRGSVPGEPTRCWLVSGSTMRSAGYAGQPSLAIDVGKDAIWVMDLTTNALVASAWLPQVTATPTEYGKLPILAVGVPGVHPLSIGCADHGRHGPEWSYVQGARWCRFSWRDALPGAVQPAFWASGADFLTLVDKFGLAPNLEVRQPFRF